MPIAPLERVLALVGAASALVLAVLVGAAWLDYRDAAPSPAAPAEPRPDSSPAAATAEGPSPARAEPAPPALRSLPTRAVLELTAARGDCWVEVRLGSETGRSLFSGILARGESRTFAGRTLWIVLGAPETIDATLNDEQVEQPAAAGPMTAVATREGLRPVSPS